MKESIKVFLAIAANEYFNIQSIDIKAAFLQSRSLDRDVFVEPPKDLKKEGVLWKLKKPYMGLMMPVENFGLDPPIGSVDLIFLLL